jgi:hypothetical protein
MKNFSTGQAAHLLGTTEPRLADLVRKGRIRPAPAVFAGRRVWDSSHIIQAAEHLCILTDELRLQIEKETSDVAR